MPAGESVCTCEFEALPLVAGSYRVEVTAVEPQSGELVHRVHDTVLVSVVGPAAEGLAAAESSWRIGDEAALEKPAGT